MKSDTSRSELINALSDVLSYINTNRRVVEEIKKSMAANKVSIGETLKLVTGQTSLEDINDLRILCLLNIATYNALKELKVQSDKFDIEQINYKNYFTAAEIKQSKTFEKRSEDLVQLPYTFKNVTKVKNGHYIVVVKASELNKLFTGGMITYNFDVQREAVVRGSKDDPGSIIKVPKIHVQNVKEMTKLMRNGELESTTLTFNARLESSEEAEELILEGGDLVVTEGTIIDVLDGFHRLVALSEVMSDPSAQGIDMTFILSILNYNQKEAERYFSQINKATPVSQSRLKSLSEDRMADFIVRQLQSSSELKGKISMSENIATTTNHLVSFKVLSDAIHEEFGVKDKPTAMKIVKFLSKFINELFLNNSEAFMTNIHEVREQSLINSNQFFYGWIVLANRFYTNNIPIHQIQDIVESINFSRDNQRWKDMNILDDKENISRNIKAKVKEFFKDLDLEEVKLDA